MRVVVGLGNPGEEYAGTRHNVGFDVVDAVSERLGARFRARGGAAAVADGRGAADPYVLVKPLTFMNRSGEALRSVASDLGLDIEESLIVLDEFQLDLGRLRIRGNGSDGGHNGLDSVLRSFGTNQVPRLRVGIGPLPQRVPPEVFVLKRFRKDELPAVAESVARAADAAEEWIHGAGVETLMNRYNVR